MPALPERRAAIACKFRLEAYSRSAMQSQQTMPGNASGQDFVLALRCVIHAAGVRISRGGCRMHEDLKLIFEYFLFDADYWPMIELTYLPCRLKKVS